jgi:hypothetical protein
MGVAENPGRTATVFACLGLSWLGLLIHNIADLGVPVLLGPDTLAPTAVYPLLAAAWLTLVRRPVAWLMLVWGSLHLLGGGVLSVLPIPLWPFQPEQSLYHYAFHALYAAVQVPLVAVLWTYLRSAAPRTPVHRSEPSCQPTHDQTHSADLAPTLVEVASTDRRSGGSATIACAVRCKQVGSQLRRWRPRRSPGRERMCSGVQSRSVTSSE